VDEAAEPIHREEMDIIRKGWKHSTLNKEISNDTRWTTAREGKRATTHCMGAGQDGNGEIVFTANTTKQAGKH